ncbi:MAG: TIGR01906 family membrane protein [Dehalococcoidaceae bacterium]|nr:TIGR01906 family membrane protein [Dehalococcoidaceae bacterium]
MPLVFFTLSVTIAFNSQWVYSYGFEKYDIPGATGLEKAELEKASRQLINYFNSEEEFIYIEVTKAGEAFELFNEREVLHLKDVKGLVLLCYNVLLFSGLYVLLFTALLLVRQTRQWTGLPRTVILGSLLTLTIIAGLGITALIDFRWFFWQFHLISFANDLWLLDPANDYLIMMFPQGFWLDATILVAGLSAGWALIAGAGSYALLYLNEKLH